MSEDSGYQGNARHAWRIRKVPDTMASCVLCQAFKPNSAIKLLVCNAYDHDLRGHICAVDFEAVRQAEEVLAIAHLEQPTDSILGDSIP